MGQFTQRSIPHLSQSSNRHKVTKTFFISNMTQTATGPIAQWSQAVVEVAKSTSTNTIIIIFIFIIIRNNHFQKSQFV